MQVYKLCWTYTHFAAVGLKIYAINAGIKKSIIKKMNKKHDKIVLLGKRRLNTIEVLICKCLINSYIVMTNLFQ